jgi:hypothetical protein
MPKFAELLSCAIFFYSADREESIHYYISRINDYHNYAKVWIKNDNKVILVPSSLRFSQ